MVLLLVRHGETDSLARGTLQGYRYGQLTSRGRRQATQLAKQLRFFHPVAIYSSDLSRARQTTEIIRKILPRVPVRYDQALREHDIGSLAGLPRREHAYRVRKSGKTQYRYRPPEGETLVEMRKRVRRLLRRLRARHPGPGAVVLVTHAWVIRHILHAARGLPVSDWSYAPPIPPGSLRVVRFSSSRPRR